MKPVAILAWIFVVVVSFIISPTGHPFFDILARVFGSILGIYLFSWLLTILATLFDKKEVRKESRQATLPYALIVISTLVFVGRLYGGK